MNLMKNRTIVLLLLLPALFSCTAGRPEITWSVMHPTQLDTVYMQRLIDESSKHPVDNFEVCGGCNSGCEGSLDGLLLFEEYPLAEAAQNREVVLHNQASLRRIIDMAHGIGKEVYYWHREVLCNDGVVASIPSLLDENGEFDLLGEPYEKFLRYKIRKTFETVPDLDGIVLTLTEASFSALHNSRPDLYPPEKVVEKIGTIFAEELYSRGKRFILRSFGSIEEDYLAIQEGAARIAEKYRFEVETKITPYDFDPFLPDNPFLNKIKGCTLGAECDVLGEFLGCGRMLPEQVEEIHRYVNFARRKKVDRYTIRLDRKGKSIFDVYPINLYAYEQAIINPGKSPEEVRREYYSASYSPAMTDILCRMSRDGMDCVKKTQYIAGNLIFHWYPTTPDLRLLKASGVLGTFMKEGNLSRGRKQWAILSFNDVPGRENIIREKNEAIEIADRNLRILGEVKDSLTAEDYRRLSEGWTVSKAEAESIGELCKVLCAYFGDMEQRRDVPAALNEARAAMDSHLSGKWLLRPLPGMADRIVEEYPMELALRKKLDASSRDYVLPGCISDQGRVEHYMLGSFCRVEDGRPVATVGNAVFPNCYLAMSLKGSEKPSCIVVRGKGECLVSVNGDEFRIVIDGDQGIVPVPAAGEYEVVLRKAPAGDYPDVVSVSLEDDALKEMAERALNFCEKQSLRMYDRIFPQRGLLVDRTGTDGQFIAAVPEQWTAGFFPGTLWLLYEHSGNPALRAAAEEMTSRMFAQQYNCNTHDIGFMMNCSYGQALRITGDRKKYADIVRNSAESLSSRFNEKVGCIRSWNNSEKKNWKYAVIIDNMMNLELLLNASSLYEDDKYRNIAVTHAETTMKNHFRENGSCFHLVDYDDVDGSVRARQTAQGLADDSSWARGQAWALYGYTVMYRGTGRDDFLGQALKVAGYIAANGNYPSDRIPYWDFDDRSGIATPRDASASAVIASACLELAGYAPEKAEELRLLASKILVSLSSDRYSAALGENSDFILKHSTINKPKGNFDTAVVYADYYYVEALTRLLGYLQ